jgi:phosphoribosylamine--glycine ligase
VRRIERSTRFRRLAGVDVLVIGGGGREHALCWRLAQDPTVTRVLAAPGNAGIAQVAGCIPDARPDDVEAMVNLVDRLDPDLVVIGPEAPLVAGLGDALRKAGRNVFGPNAAAARIEGSKAFAKEVMARRGVPTARAGAFTDVDDAIAFVDALGGSAVVKADGLAAGKGVTVAQDRDDAVAAIREALVDRAFGDAGATVLVEELLEGPEVSVFAVTDGNGNCALLDAAADHKRIGDADTGPNTGGMGAYSPVPLLDEATATEILDTVIAPVIDEIRPYRGVLFAGMMLTEDGPRVLEFNCRFGDPETQVLMPRMPYEVGTLLHACATGRLAFEAGHAGFDDGAAVTVVLASEGYPGPYEVGRPIDGVDAASTIEGVTVFHAGTARDADGQLVTAGGRVLAVTGQGATLNEARTRAYGGVAEIRFEGMRFRTDIAAHAAALEGATR